MNTARMIKPKPKLILILLLVTSLLAILQIRQRGIALAADVDFSDGITVDSTLDTSDANVGNGECDDGNGNCTLRAAIEEANANSDFSEIKFNISSGLQVIQPATQYPTISEQIYIDGYTQPGSNVNTAISPNPFNGTLAIKIDGSLLPNVNTGQITDCFKIEDTDSTTISGLIISNCGGTALNLLRSDGTEIIGNYIGVDETGLIDEGNGQDSNNGIGVNIIASNNVLVGGANPEDRNIIAGNQNQDIYFGNEDDDTNGSSGITIKGNYVGLGADGLTAIPAGWEHGKGNAILMGNSYDDQIGGASNGDKNVIASSYEYGVSLRDGCVGTEIIGNYIGTDYTGTNAAAHTLGSGNIRSGIHIGRITGYVRSSHDIVVGGPTSSHRNVISGNTALQDPDLGSGIGVDEEAYNVVIQNNYVGVGSDGQTAVTNSGPGIRVSGLAATISIESNTVSGNDMEGIQINFFSNDVSITENIIGTNANGNTAIPNGAAGIKLSEGVFNITTGGSGVGNLISGNLGDGIGVDSLAGTNNTIQGNYIGTDVTGQDPLPNFNGISSGASGLLIGGANPGEGNIITHNDDLGIVISGSNTSNNTVLGNTIYDNGDLGMGLDFDGVTPNDLLDADSGPNDLLNFPSDVEYDENGGNTNIQYTLDVPAGDYRIEFYSNAIADGSGYGEGQVFLDFQNVTSTGSGSQQFNKVLTGTGLQNLALTTTEISPSNNFGFGSTSEFSQIPPSQTDITITKSLTNPTAIATGGTATYQVTVANEGPDPVNLSNYNTFGSNNLLLDIAHPDLTPSDLGAAGPLPGSYFISDTGNQDVTCLWAGPNSGNLAGNMPSHADHGLMLCFYSGSDSTLTSGGSISITLNFTISTDSDLTFSNYAMVPPPQDSEDPDQTVYTAVTTSGNDIIDEFLSYYPDSNNFSVAAYPVPVATPPEDLPANTGNLISLILGATGDNIVTILMLGGFLLSTTATVLAFKLRGNEQDERNLG